METLAREDFPCDPRYFAEWSESLCVGVSVFAAIPECRATANRATQRGLHDVGCNE